MEKNISSENADNTSNDIEIILKNLGGKIKSLRKIDKMTAQELADKLHVSQPYISQIEKGKRNANARIIRDMADIFGVPYGYLMSDDVITLDEFKAVQSLSKDYNGKRYIPYYVVVDKAIDKEITPDEFEDALNFITKYKNKNKNASQEIGVFNEKL